MKIVLSFILLFIFSSTLLFSQFGGGGPGDTKDNAYQIWTKSHLEELCDSINNGGYSNWTVSKHFLLMQDIDNVTLFIGSLYANLYGRGKKVTLYDEGNFFSSGSKLGYIFDSLVINSYVTLAGTLGTVNGTVSCYINNAPIIDLGKEGIYGNMIYYAGGISLYNYGTISHCLNNGDVSGVDCIGGIAGHNNGNNGQIINCINTGKITASNSGVNLPGSVPGVAGISVSYSYGYISNCINLGDIEGVDYVSGIVACTGGGVSYFIPKIVNCINAGYIKGKKNVGGIVGESYYDYYMIQADITNCLNTGVVEGEEDVGSIVGK